MLIEIFSEVETVYMRAPVKPFDVVDLAGLKFDDELKPETPEELYAAIPATAMRETEVVRKAVSEGDWKKGGNLEGVYKVDNVFYESQTTWNWYDIFTFSNKDPGTGKKWTKGGKVKYPVGYNRTFESFLTTKRLKLI
jgi:hypothetical protein